MSAAEIFSVKGKVAFATGAGSGLGRAMAEAMAENGASVSCLDLNPDGLQDTRRLCQLAGAKVVTIAGDGSDKAAVDAAVERTVAELGRLDIAFANAGVGDPEPALLHEYDDANWKRVVDVNLNGVFYTDRAALRQMMKQGGGKIINTASMWGVAGASSVFPLPAYTATKGAVVNLTRELALQYATHNIQINAICPGFFLTNLGPYGDPEFMAATTAFTPMGRLADPSEIKGTALYLASSASSFVTGAMILTDGGCMAK